MVCPKCGKVFAQGMRFCDVCGTPLIQGPPQQNNPGGQPYPGQRQMQGMNRQSGYMPSGGGNIMTRGVDPHNPVWLAAIISAGVLLLSIFLPFAGGVSLISAGRVSGGVVQGIFFLLFSIACGVFLCMGWSLLALVAAISNFSWFLFYFMIFSSISGGRYEFGYYIWLLSSLSLFGCCIAYYIKKSK